jgi:single-strand DNA-binding protein
MANKVFLMGRLTKDPEIRTGNTQVARYTLAIDRRFSNSEEKTDFINIVAFGKSAEFAEKYLKKGMKVLVTGRIQTGSYTDKDNKKVYTTDIVVEDQEFCESKGNSTQNERPTTDDDFMDIPANVKDDMPF